MSIFKNAKKRRNSKLNYNRIYFDSVRNLSRGKDKKTRVRMYSTFFRANANNGRGLILRTSIGSRARMMINRKKIYKIANKMNKKRTGLKRSTTWFKENVGYFSK